MTTGAPLPAHRPRPPAPQERRAVLVLEDGTQLEGFSFGADKEVNGEVVFSTGMVGYPGEWTCTGGARARRVQPGRACAAILGST